MRAAVIYESMFGNTELVAQAIAQALPSMAAEAMEVGATESLVLADLDLLVVGAPTHTFSMSRETTRLSAAKMSDAPLVSAHGGIREWLSRLPRAHPGQFAATFDTHLEQMSWLGSAARPIAKRLRRLGYGIVVAPQHFYVVGTPGPLRAGELERAADWAHLLAGTAVSMTATPVAG
jgi:flavorubredoxin